MKYILTTFLLLGLVSCSSSSKDDKHEKFKKSAQNKKDQPQKVGKTKFKSQVMYVDENGVRKPVNLKGSEVKTLYDPQTGKPVKSGGWVDLSSSRPGKYLEGKSISELKLLSENASPHEATLIIEELLVRKDGAISVLAAFLNDSRTAVFSKNREHWWYEAKNKPAEMVELRIYAAFTLQQKVGLNPRAVTITMTKDKMFVGVRNGFAVVKEDVAKVWQEWWQKSMKDYK
ncbi:MAG: hypothetical protein NE334_08205 [Lentisphaeraceae bacterium]|nr:hypothetical protein [Lentisphaeraceae bacterium]